MNIHRSRPEIGSELPMHPVTITEASPVVAFDVRMGDTYEYVDFDYATFDKEASRLGMQAEAKAGLKIDIVSTHAAGNGAVKLGGSYTPETKTIHIATNQKPEEVNKSFRHELKHAADDAEGALYTDTRMKIGKLAIIGTKPAVAAEILSGLANIADVSRIAEIPYATETFAGSVAAFAVTVGAGIWGYSRHPSEVAAKRSAAETNTQIIHLRPK